MTAKPTGEESRTSAPTSDEGVDTTELAAIHDFGSKLLQPSLIDRLREYVAWQAQLRTLEDPSVGYGEGPCHAPVSINLDLTTVCNYACDHCVDMDILNMGVRYRHEQLIASLERMIDGGLRSVILIGGGEPTLYPHFGDVVRLLKERRVSVAVVSNGSGMRRVGEVAQLFDELDWVRLSLDSGTDATFQAMHKPKRAITLESICADVADVKRTHPNLRVGFSFIVTWKGAFTNDTAIVENIDEIERAARLARDHLFDYISIKPFLVRSPENNAEIVGVDEERSAFAPVLERIRAGIAAAREHETPTFKVVESTNLRVFENQSAERYTRQPQSCHMQYFRQVLSPLGLFNCPVYRHVEQARMGDRDSWSSAERERDTHREVGRLIGEFHAAHECREVTCLYNSANWMIEELIRDPHKLDALAPTPERHDFFL